MTHFLIACIIVAPLAIGFYFFQKWDSKNPRKTTYNYKPDELWEAPKYWKFQKTKEKKV